MGSGYPMAKRTTRELHSNRVWDMYARAVGIGLAMWSCSAAADVTLTWNAVNWPGNKVYNVYYGTASHSYGQRVSVANTNKVTLPGLDDNATYFFAVTCVADGYESEFSTELVFNLSTTPPSLTLKPADGGQTTLQGTAPSGHLYDVLATQDFTLWQAIGAVAVDASGSFIFVDPAAAHYPTRFYRLHETTYTAPGSLPTARLLPGKTGPRQLQITGEVGHVYDVLATEDLVTWKAIGNVTAGAHGFAKFTDGDPRFYPKRFYLLHDITYARAQADFHLTTRPDGTVQLLVTGLTGHTYDIMTTQDLVSWHVLDQVTIAMGGGAVVIDPNRGAFFQFYELREVPGL